MVESIVRSTFGPRVGHGILSSWTTPRPLKTLPALRAEGSIHCGACERRGVWSRRSPRLVNDCRSRGCLAAHRADHAFHGWRWARVTVGRLPGWSQRQCVNMRDPKGLDAALDAEHLELAQSIFVQGLPPHSKGLPLRMSKKRSSPASRVQRALMTRAPAPSPH